MGFFRGREWGVGSVVVGFGVFGAPRFSLQTPHFRPSEFSGCKEHRESLQKCNLKIGNAASLTAPPQNRASLEASRRAMSFAIQKLGEEFAGLRPEKLGLAPKVLQNLWGSAEAFFNKLFCYAKRSTEPSCKPQRFCRILWNLWEPGPVF